MTCALAGAASADLLEDWVSRYDGPASGIDQATAIAVDHNGDVFVTGRSWGLKSNYDYATVKYDGETGQQLWATRYNGPGNGADEALAIVVDAAGDVYVTGGSWGETSHLDYATLKYNGQTGQQVWVMRWNGSHNAIDVARAIAVDDATNHVIVTGGSWGTGTGVDMLTIKHRTNTGGMAWIHRLSAGGTGTAQGTAVAVDSNGDVFITGPFWGGTGTNFDYGTVKYNGDNGVRIWTKLFNGPANLADDAYALAVDANDDVYVTGSVTIEFGRTDFATIKYNGEDGKQLWVSYYNGPASGQDVAHDIAIDAAGDVYVTGRSPGNGTDRDFATIKYRASDGVELWSARYNGPGSSVDEAYSIAVRDLTVYVTGRSWGAGSDYDYATLRYDTSTGEQTGEARYSGPGAAGDQAAALAIGPDGAVFVTGGSTGVGTSFDYATVRYTSALLIPPAFLNVFRGFVVSGGLPEILTSNDEYLVVRPGFVLSTQEAPIQIILETSSPSSNPSFLSFRLEARASVNNINQRVELYDFVDDAWVLLDTRPAATTDTTVEVEVSEPGRFIEDGTLTMRARISYRQNGPVIAFPWTASIDYATWVLTQ